jgi:hypothetical protein
LSEWRNIQKSNALHKATQHHFILQHMQTVVPRYERWT